MSDEKKLGDISVKMGDGNVVEHIGHKIVSPTPRLVISSTACITENADGTFVSIQEFDAPDPVARAAIQARGPNIVKMEISQAPPPGATAFGSSKSKVQRWQTEAGCEEEFGPLHGKYLVTVITRGPPAFELAHKIC